jgi:two-component system OmpR family response regulator
MGTRQHILLVEDDEAVLDVLAVALRMHGYEVATATTVQEAEAIMQQPGAAAIALVIADINLTRQREAREGYALYQRWATTYPALRYLLISGDQRNTTLPAIHIGAVPFLAKPFGIRELVTTVQGLLSATVC